MTGKQIFLLTACLMGLSAGTVVEGQSAPNSSQPAGQPFHLPKFQSTRPVRASIQADPVIAKALKDISAMQIQHTIETLVQFGNRSTLSSAQPAASGHGITAARDWIKSQFEAYSKDCGGCLDVQLDTFTQPVSERVPQPTELSNVYAVLRGTDHDPASAASAAHAGVEEKAKRIVLVTGHYDSRNSDPLNTTDAAPGANDDGSGVAISLECARVLSKLKFPATIIFLTVAGEEQGLYGSKHFAQMAKQKNWQIEAVLNNDIVGGDKNPEQNPKTVRVFSEGVPVAASEADLRRIRALGGENDSPSRELARYIDEVGSAYLSAYGFAPTLIYRRDRYLRGGDHTSFNEEGFTAIRFTEWREDFHHQHQNVRVENGIEYGDLPKFVNFDYVANVARLNAATLASLALAPAPPQDVKILTKELENNSRLTWTPASGIQNEILWRPTDASQWNVVPNTQAFMAESSAGHVDQELANIDLSKDNVIFAVRAVDAQGHKSLPVVPTPERN
ncbi:MAG TPA: M20/M25/M40 family metallo-hydrolase [Terriglobales bacterium]|nr:M20/M25/M40 family metallo-hydrolase [Terriglobales bacterium]